jgi:hypothetical protein
MNAISFFSGIIVATFLASALFFLKFWKASRDRFFLFFSIACALITLDRIVALCIHATQETFRSEATDEASWVYLIRLLAFVVITIAIVDKNRSSKWK